MLRRKPAPPEEEGAPAWMNTYGDMVTLLLTFFVLLFSFSTINAQKWEEIVYSMKGAPYVAVQALDADEVIQEAMQGDTWVPAVATTPEPETPGAEEDNGLVGNRKKFVELYEKIQAHIKENNLESIINAVKEDDDLVLIRMTDSALFDSAKVDIRPDAQVVLTEICNIIDEYNELIEIIWIEGHTDIVPINSQKYKDNTDLSAMRATNVRRFVLSFMEIEPFKVVPIGYGEYRPVDTNDTEQGKANNRRVDFVIQAKLEE